MSEVWTAFVVALTLAVGQAAPYVVVGYLVAAVLREWVPPERLAASLGRSGPGPLLRAVGAGLLLPVCSCGVVPLGIGAARAGAAPGTVLAFMLSAPAVSPVSLLLGGRLLGPGFVAVHAATVLLGALALGAVGNRVLAPPALADGARAAAEGAAAGDARSALTRLRAAGRWAFWDLGADVSVDLTLGLALAAAISALVPPAVAARWVGGGGLGPLLAIVALAVPLYVCTVPSLPIAQRLVALGASPGAALAFLVAGPATNLGELNVIRGALGGRAAGLFAGWVVALAVGAGLVAERLFVALAGGGRGLLLDLEVAAACCVPATFSGEGPAAGVLDALATIPAWHLPFGLLLAATLASGLARRAARRWGALRSPPASTSPEAA